MERSGRFRVSRSLRALLPLSQARGRSLKRSRMPLRPVSLYREKKWEVGVIAHTSMVLKAEIWPKVGKRGRTVATSQASSQTYL